MIMSHISYKLEKGDVVVAEFKDRDSYLDLIHAGFVNYLISEVKVQIITTDDITESEFVLFLTIGAPGIDRIVQNIEDRKGKILFPQ